MQKQCALCFSSYPYMVDFFSHLEYRGNVPGVTPYVSGPPCSQCLPGQECIKDLLCSNCRPLSLKLWAMGRIESRLVKVCKPTTLFAIYIKQFKVVACYSEVSRT